ncbi:MAG: CcoQ/FixQ family Cbb3-type cytochrome c oxidase assembly chaperone [Flavobacteriales bacterium]|nr:CcoQ/FixQ family Cbb3-type cytochrome c oxidase assembly chaperone [Flavobacteriales bacterium]
MLKFIKHNMETIMGIEIFPIISFLIFFIFFCVLFIWVARMQKAEVNMLSALPLEDGDKENETSTNL